MATPLTPVQQQIFEYFPIGTHPRRTLEAEVCAYATGNVLDIGCGRTAPMLKLLRGKVDQLYGIDLVDFDTEIPDARLLNADVCNMDFLQTDSINLAYSKAVMEHIPDCKSALGEIARVLKPGGHYIFLTPNFWDYVTLVAHIVPNRFHDVLVSTITDRAEEDVFPTYFRCNRKSTIYRLAKESGLEVTRFDYMGQHPAYLTFSRPLFWFGSQYERVIRSIPQLGFLRGWIFCILQKPVRNGPNG